MYKDDLWYTHFTRAIEERKSQFSDKQQAQYQIDFILRLARRVRDGSDRSETCRGFQHTLTRLEEEMGELPGSKAQRQYHRKMLAEMSEYFVKQYRLAPPQYYAHKGMLYGVSIGVALGAVAGFLIVSTIPLFLVGGLIGLLVGWLSGNMAAQRVTQEGRVI